MQEEVSLVQKEVVLNRLQSFNQLAFVENVMHQLLRAPLVGPLYRFKEIELRVQISGPIGLGIMCFLHLFIPIS